jgi:hypothetical protein
MRSASLVCFALLGLSVAVGCGSVAKNGGTGGNGSAGAAGTAGGAGTSGAGGASATDGGAGSSGDAGAGGQTGGGVRLRGGIESVGPSSPDAGAGTTRIIRAGLTYSRARICNGSVCVAGGLAP